METGVARRGIGCGRPAHRPAPASATGWNLTITGAPIPPLAANRLLMTASARRKKAGLPDCISLREGCRLPKNCRSTCKTKQKSYRHAGRVPASSSASARLMSHMTARRPSRCRNESGMASGQCFLTSSVASRPAASCIYRHGRRRRLRRGLRPGKRGTARCLRSHTLLRAGAWCWKFPA